MQRRHYDCTTSTAVLMASRRDMWPEPIPLRDKLYGNLKELRRTVAFVRAVDIYCTTTTKKMITNTTSVFRIYISSSIAAAASIAGASEMEIVITLLQFLLLLLLLLFFVDNNGMIAMNTMIMIRNMCVTMIRIMTPKITCNVYLQDGSAQTFLLGASQRQIQTFISTCHGNPAPERSLYR